MIGHGRRQARRRLRVAHSAVVGIARKLVRGCARFIYETLRVTCFLAVYFKEIKVLVFSQMTGSSSLLLFW